MGSIICGHHVYKNVWQPVVEKRLFLEREEDTSQDRCAISLVKDSTVVRHVPRVLSQCFLALYTAWSYHY